MGENRATLKGYSKEEAIEIIRAARENPLSDIDAEITMHEADQLQIDDLSTATTDPETSG